jgi:hypothetical protein
MPIFPRLVCETTPHSEWCESLPRAERADASQEEEVNV